MEDSAEFDKPQTLALPVGKWSDQTLRWQQLLIAGAIVLLLLPVVTMIWRKHKTSQSQRPPAVPTATATPPRAASAPLAPLPP